MRIAAILVAAGRGVRMGRDTPKAFLQLGGKPLFRYALDTLASVEAIGSIHLVVGGDQITAAEQYLRAAPFTRVQVIEGGAERQDSVAAGMAAAAPGVDLILVHDAARPFVSRRCVVACIDAASAHGAAIAALPAHDTIKQVDDKQRITATLDRTRIWLAQTPQVVRADWLREGFAQAAADHLKLTDEAGLMEHCGRPVQVVQGEATNRKLTTPEDLEWAEWFLQRPH